MKKVLAFDVWGQYGHFRKRYTTTSPLTYSVPPRTAVSGLIGAIIGLDKNEYFNHFTKQNSKISIRLLNPVKKVTLSENLIDTNSAGFNMNRIKQRTQIRVELLKDPKFRIYLCHEDSKLFQKLADYLEDHKSIYTPYLGLSEYLANFSLNGVFDAEEIQPTEYARVNSVVPEDKIHEIDLETDYEYMKEKLPNEMTPERIVKEYAEILFEQKAKSIKAQVMDLIHLENGDNIVFL